MHVDWHCNFRRNKKHLASYSVWNRITSIRKKHGKTPVCWVAMFEARRAIVC